MLVELMWHNAWLYTSTDAIIWAAFPTITLIPIQNDVTKQMRGQGMLEWSVMNDRGSCTEF